MTRRFPIATSRRRASRFLAGLAVVFIAGCAAVPDDAPVVENTDEETGVTIARLGRPVEFYNDDASKGTTERFAFLGPFETNQMGSRALFLWLAVPMENPAGSTAPRVTVDGTALELGNAGTSAQFAGLTRSPYKIPTPWFANFYYRIDDGIVARLATAANLRIEAVDQAKRGPVDLAFSAELGNDPRLAGFAAR
jgi:hypothetical protein